MKWETVPPLAVCITYSWEAQGLQAVLCAPGHHGDGLLLTLEAQVYRQAVLCQLRDPWRCSVLLIGGSGSTRQCCVLRAPWRWLCGLIGDGRLSLLQVRVCPVILPSAYYFPCTVIIYYHHGNILLLITLAPFIQTI